MFPPLRMREAWNLGGLTVRQVLWRTWNKLNDNEILTRASAVAFYAMLAMVPMIALFLTVTVNFLPDLSGLNDRPAGGAGHLTVTQLRGALQNVLPEEGYRVVEDQIGRMQKEPPFGLISLGLLIALWSASSLFLAVMDALNRVAGVTETRGFIRLRITAVIMTLIQAAILLGALIAIVVGPEILEWLGFRGHLTWFAIGLQWTIVVAMVLASFALTFYVGPDAEQRWEWLTPGSILGMLVFLGFTWLFRVYIQNFSNYNKTYGSLGGVMVMLLWFWVTAVVLLTAGQMNHVIEDASPLGKNHGQKADIPAAPDLSNMTLKPMDHE